MLQFPGWKVALILIVCAFGTLLALPNVLTPAQRADIPGFLPNKPVNLGLDLRGGVYLLLEVDHQRSVAKQLEDLSREARSRLNATRGEDRIYYSDMHVQTAGVRFDVANADQIDTALNVLKTGFGDQSGIRVSRQAGNAIELMISDELSEVIKRDPSKSITSELEEIRRKTAEILQADPAITYSNLEITDPSFRFRPRDPAKLDAAVSLMRNMNNALGSALGGAGLQVRVVDGGEVDVHFTSQQADEIKRDAVRQTVAKLGPRLDPNGIGEISIQPQGEDRIIIEAPGETDPARLKALIQQPGELTLNLVSENQAYLQQAYQTGRVPDGFKIVSTSDGNILVVEDDPIIEGDMVKSATQGLHPENNTPIVNFTLTTRGAALFGKATGANVGRRFAIVLDGESKSAPRINSPIPGGSGFIEGDFTRESAQDLATIIQAGALPADIVVLKERTVGPSLGQDSIEAGTTASIVGLILVAVFMLVAYGLFGGFAVGSLIANIVLILGALSGLGATLTLPGIAGIILTIGMAVDANVLVFERIREEGRNGRSPMSAIDIGYQQAMSTIFDANITTLLAAAVLYTLGSGPVKGFAVTLAIGIFTSVFTAFVLTRWFTVIWLRTTRPKKLPI